MQFYFFKNIAFDEGQAQNVAWNQSRWNSLVLDPLSLVSGITLVDHSCGLFYLDRMSTLFMLTRKKRTQTTGFLSVGHPLDTHPRRKEEVNGLWVSLRLIGLNHFIQSVDFCAQWRMCSRPCHISWISTRCRRYLPQVRQPQWHGGCCCLCHIFL